MTIAKKSFILIALILSSLHLFSCGNESAKLNLDTDSLLTKKEIKEPEKVPEPINIQYSALAIKSDSSKKYFKDHFTDEEKKIIYGLNRVDARNVFNPDTLIIPDTFLTDWLVYCPFPTEVPELKQVKKIVIFSYPIQAFAAYEAGKLTRWGPTSLGSKVHPTPTGLHFTNWKSKKSISTVKDEWILPWNFNIMNKGGVGWHEYAMPGYPASHSCLRLHQEDAMWLYSFADQWILKNSTTLSAKGTPVIVFGEYPFGERRPWRHLLEDPKANDISEKELNSILKPYLTEILQEQKIREEVSAPASVEDSSSTS